MLTDPVETAVKEIELKENAGQLPTIQAVYNANGVQVPQHVLEGGKGIYFIRYSNGSTKKVFVE